MPTPATSSASCSSLLAFSPPSPFLFSPLVLCFPALVLSSDESCPSNCFLSLLSLSPPAWRPGDPRLLRHRTNQAVSLPRKANPCKYQSPLRICSLETGNMNEVEHLFDLHLAHALFGTCVIIAMPNLYWLSSFGRNYEFVPGICSLPSHSLARPSWPTTMPGSPPPHLRTSPRAPISPKKVSPLARVGSALRFRMRPPAPICPPQLHLSAHLAMALDPLPARYAPCHLHSNTLLTHIHQPAALLPP